MPTNEPFLSQQGHAHRRDHAEDDQDGNLDLEWESNGYKMVTRKASGIFRTSG
jgi:hypothetical protein